MPRTGPCSPWVTGADVAALISIQRVVAEVNANAVKANLPGLSEEQVAIICAEAATAASEILYSLSGRVFTGACGPVTIRPVARPENADTRGWVFAGGGGWGYGWGASATGNLGLPPVMALYAEDFGPYIELYDYPVNEIIQVKIDGVVIPPDQYELRENKWLIRMLPTPDTIPAQRWGWPTSQQQWLPDTQLQTFSITYTYGQDPGAGGRLACRVLAESIAMPLFGNANRYPERVTTINRQGVTAQIASVVDVMRDGRTGILDVDRWVLAVNPEQLRRRPVVFSPDIARNMRQRYPSVPG